MSGDRDLTPAEARSRFIRSRRGDNRESTVRSYDNRLAEFVGWCRERDIESMRELDGLLLDDYSNHLDELGQAPATVKGKTVAVMQLLQYCERVGIVEEDLSNALSCPELSKAEQTSDEKLETEDAKALIQYFRNSTARKGTARHVVLELIWHIGCRTSCLRALDIRDWHPEDRVLSFRDRPPTRLKRGDTAHERNVAVSEPVADAIELWIARERPDKRDDQGRRPLLATTHGRAVSGTIQGWSYLGTQPCLHMECPHNRQRHSCRYTLRSHASKCPSSRGPHAIRTGSITWQLNCGLSYVEVAERVAASPETIRRYYDKPDLDEELARRRPATEDLDVETTEEL